MNTLQVLVATMNQSDLSKYKDMNIQTDVIFANQAHEYEYRKESVDGNTVTMITSPQRGVGRNRNTALLHATADICLFSDDDMIYVDGYEKNVIDSFESLPDADIIIFQVDTLNKDRSDNRTISKISRVNLKNFMRYGTYRVAIKRTSILKKNIWFTLLFGGGTKYGAGEDSLFLREALKKGLNIYTYPYKIADVKQESSTWFKGYNEKYFFDKGAFLSAAFPVLKYLLAVYFMFRFKKLTSLSFIKMFRLIQRGMKAFRDGASYDEWKEKSLNS